MSRIDYSKWDDLDCSESEEDEQTMLTKRIEKMSGKDIREVYEETHEEFFETVSGNKISSSSSRDYSSSLATSDSPTPVWRLVTHYKDLFARHVLPHLNESDQKIFSVLNKEAQRALEYAGVDLLELEGPWFEELSSVKTIEMVLKYGPPWGYDMGRAGVWSQAEFVKRLTLSGRIDFLRWAREVKKFDWDHWSPFVAASEGYLDLLEYCVDNNCPARKQETVLESIQNGHLDIVKYLVKKKFALDEEECVVLAARNGQLDILKYFMESKTRAEALKHHCTLMAVQQGQLECLKYLIEEVKTPLNVHHVVMARGYKQQECLKYLIDEKSCPKPEDITDFSFVHDRDDDDRMDTLNYVMNAMMLHDEDEQFNQYDYI